MQKYTFRKLCRYWLLPKININKSLTCFARLCANVIEKLWTVINSSTCGFLPPYSAVAATSEAKSSLTGVNGLFARLRVNVNEFDLLWIWWWKCGSLDTYLTHTMSTRMFLLIINIAKVLGAVISHRQRRMCSGPGSVPSLQAQLCPGQKQSTTTQHTVPQPGVLGFSVLFEVCTAKKESNNGLFHWIVTESDSAQKTRIG